ncbi:MAG: YbaK/EbsC family protein [Gammaproteobacteria bacterium]|nr:YbaK/EbsC family protein [Gammaproteobacteria bacterium]
MSIPIRVGEYLSQQQVSFDTVSHISSTSSISTAIASKIPAANIAKAVILEDHQGRYLMAILPADRKISLHKLQTELDMSLHLVQQSQLDKMFTDCDQGAIPALNQPYHINAVYDDTLTELADVYLEGGDHRTLIHLNQQQFAQLMLHTKHYCFSSQMVH